MTRMSLAGRRPVNWNVLSIDAARPEDYRSQLEACDQVAEAGGKAMALTMPILVGMNMHFHTFCALYSLPDWGEVMNLPHDEKVAALSDPETRRHLETRAASPDAGVFSRLTGWRLYRIGDTYSGAQNEGLKGRLVGDIARERGQRDFYTLLDIVLADDLRTVLWPGPTDDDPASWIMRQGGLGPRPRHDRRFGRRCPPRPDGRRQLHDPVAGRAACAARSLGPLWGVPSPT
ncbi:MAG: hypothetical protein CM1200mP26_01710 [Acidimicrobiales bacterium]|nr:MAG: hypothetical protein CM1200mP26_01710 [Acidimicrobiales bacterium]